jgi:hypothetical protein
MKASILPKKRYTPLTSAQLALFASAKKKSKPSDPLPLETKPTIPPETKTTIPLETKTASQSLLYPAQCDALPPNYHGDVAKILIAFFDQQARDPTELRICGVKGPTGSGKSFAVRRACQEAGYELVELHGGMEDEEFKSRRLDFLHRGCAMKKIRVLLVDNVDELEVPKRKIMIPSKPSSKRLRLKYNAVVMTYTDYVPELQPLRKQKKTPPIFQECVCKPLTPNEVSHLVALLCQQNQKPSVSLGPIYAQVGMDMGAILSQIYCEHYFKTQGNQNHWKDRTELDLFEALDLVLRPPEQLKNVNQVQWRSHLDTNTELERYVILWRMGPEPKMGEVVWNTYLKRILPGPSGQLMSGMMTRLRSETDSPGVRSYSDSEVVAILTDTFVGSLDKSWWLSDAYSVHDIIRGDEFFDTEPNEALLLGSIRMTMLKGDPKKPFFPPEDLRPLPKITDSKRCLNYCVIDQGQLQVLQMVATIHHVEQQKKQEDFKYQPDPIYSWDRLIGKRWRFEADQDKWFVCDAFATKGTGKDWEWTDKKAKSILPPLGVECVKLVTLSAQSTNLVS